MLFPSLRSYLDMLKVIMFSYLFWFVLTIIFITGTTRISVFCMGYLVACFYFLLFGGNLLLKPIKKILRFWDFLIAYNVFVITMKNVFAVSVLYLKEMHLQFSASSAKIITLMYEIYLFICREIKNNISTYILLIFYCIFYFTVIILHFIWKYIFSI